MADQLVASSSLPPSWRYHVFLSFKGEDTGTNFTDHLYHALVGKEIKTFIDRDLPRGEEISLSLLKTIEESRIALVIFSKNYASSRWCLEELVKIHQCRESKQQIILPIFYKVDPSHVRNQRGCYGDAFIRHEREFEDKEMVLMWRRALTKVANLSGYHVKEKDYEATIIGNIVKDILDRIPDGTYLKSSHLPKKSTYQSQITLDGYDFYEGEPFRDSQRVLRKSYDVWDDEIKQQQKILALRSNNNNKYLRNTTDVYTVVDDLEPLVLPSPFVLKSNNNNRYLRYMLDQENNINQILQFSAQDHTSKFAQFQVERANSRDHQNNHYVHIKCLYNGKYLRRMDNYKIFIVAAADSRDENTERWTCTLFKPESVIPTGNNRNNVLCRLRHMATGLYTKPFVDNKLELRLGEEDPDPQEVDVYTAIRTHT